MVDAKIIPKIKDCIFNIDLPSHYYNPNNIVIKNISISEKIENDITVKYLNFEFGKSLIIPYLGKAVLFDSNNFKIKNIEALTRYDLYGSIVKKSKGFKYYFHKIYVFMSDEDLKKLNIIENYKDGYYYLKNELNNNFENVVYETFNKVNSTEIIRIYNDINDFDQLLNHIIFNSKSEYIQKFKQKPKTYLLTENIKYSYGIEIECSKGILKPNVYGLYNVHCERDGSLNNKEGGPEFITDVIQGDFEILDFQKLCKELAKRCEIDKFCSIHLHIGNTQKTNKFIVNLYLLCKSTEAELFTIMPESRRKNEYCRPIENVISSNTIEILKKCKYSQHMYYDLLFKDLFKTASGGIELSSELNKNHNHPKGSKAGYNHNSIRYWWINFIPLIFKTRNTNDTKTIEFRLHSATLNFEKIYMWMLICSGIVKYAEENIIEEDKQYLLKDIINYAFKKKSNTINNYIEHRKNVFNLNSEAEKLEYHKLKEKQIINKTIKELVCV